jgi:hypothetical protein
MYFISSLRSEIFCAVPKGDSQDLAHGPEMGAGRRLPQILLEARVACAFVADGYLNKRVAVLDSTTGEFKRFWGAYGNKPDDSDLGLYDPKAPPSPQFRNPVHCAEPSADGLLSATARETASRSSV